ncbi:kinase-like domain-containing protein [Blyttiomyces helicus]|uniref:Kinase-like domain-containing protein n=1 Tax=Blyttiomyces helicus TaxID=388810 RepID=A0A4P9W6U9_9FUNG|nr:kinase-like domain-containing protein [Blyttiomyces helicus]|eukprot:RKO88191.1 kinase-like domain-containing protein [Blyttiomyces helicus]
MERALTCLRRASAGAPAPEVFDWTITSWEVTDGEVIARGGFGEVARGKWLGHTEVAIKRLFVRLDTARLREDFLREVRVWYPLRHPNVLPLLGACATAERPFMISPFMSRGHALQYIEKTDDRVEALRILYQISQGMQYLHSRRIVHGDLKAVNVLIDEHGKAYVSDFGFTVLKKVSATRKTTATASLTGTLRWMAPERLMGGKLEPPVDVYAFAMTCYEILSGGDIPMSGKLTPMKSLPAQYPFLVTL